MAVSANASFLGQANVELKQNVTWFIASIYAGPQREMKSRSKSKVGQAIVPAGRLSSRTAT